jgi:ankyrin repeat protein
MNTEDLLYLKNAFKDLLNYQSENPFDEIDPLLYSLPEGDSCLHLAASRGDIRSMKLLISAGLDLNKKGDMSCTPLHIAYGENQKAAVDLLIQSGADQNAVDEFGRTPKECQP